MGNLKFICDWKLNGMYIPDWKICTHSLLLSDVISPICMKYELYSYFSKFSSHFIPFFLRWYPISSSFFFSCPFSKDWFTLWCIFQSLDSFSCISNRAVVKRHLLGGVHRKLFRGEGVDREFGCEVPKKLFDSHTLYFGCKCDKRPF